MTLQFFANSILLGVGLAMDAFSVSMANGLKEPNMPRHRMFLIAGTFAFFQFLMPMIGWICVHTIVETFVFFQKFIPWIALGLLGYIGGKMILESRREENGEEHREESLNFRTLFLQGIATSIDALSVGFTIADYSVGMATAASVIIAIVTLIICLCGVKIGEKFGMKLSGKSMLLGGCILIFIGIEIFVSAMLG